MDKAFSILLACIVIGILAFPFWASRPGNVPSSFFRMVDRDDDLAVSYAEWRAALEAKRDWLQQEWDFHAMDCNSDDSLTWFEYRRVVFKGAARCGKDSDPATRPRAAHTFSHCDIDGRTCVIVDGGLAPWPPAGPIQEVGDLQ